MLSVLLYLFLLLPSSPALAVDWDPFNQMNKDEENIIMPAAASQQGVLDQSWPPPETQQWKEDADKYTVSVPLRLPEDADKVFMSYKYTDGVLKITVPKKKFKSII